MKKLILCASLALASDSIANAAVTFTGGGSSDLVITLTSDLGIPVYSPVSGSGIIFNIVFKDVYTTDQIASSGSPTTAHSSGIQAVMDRVDPLSDPQSRAYATWGTRNDSISSPRDLTISFNFGLQNSLALRGTDTDRTFILTAGSVSLPSSLGLALPDSQPSSVQLFSFTSAIPEPSSLAIAVLGMVSFLRRRR